MRRAATIGCPCGLQQSPLHAEHGCQPSHPSHCWGPPGMPKQSGTVCMCATKSPQVCAQGAAGAHSHTRAPGPAACVHADGLLGMWEQHGHVELAEAQGQLPVARELKVGCWQHTARLTLVRIGCAYRWTAFGGRARAQMCLAWAPRLSYRWHDVCTHNPST